MSAFIQTQEHFYFHIPVQVDHPFLVWTLERSYQKACVFQEGTGMFIAAFQLTSKCWMISKPDRTAAQPANLDN